MKKIILLAFLLNSLAYGCGKSFFVEPYSPKDTRSDVFKEGKAEASSDDLSKKITDLRQKLEDLKRLKAEASFIELCLLRLRDSEMRKSSSYPD